MKNMMKKMTWAFGHLPTDGQTDRQTDRRTYARRLINMLIVWFSHLYMVMMMPCTVAKYVIKSEVIRSTWAGFKYGGDRIKYKYK